MKILFYTKKFLSRWLKKEAKSSTLDNQKIYTDQRFLWGFLLKRYFAKTETFMCLSMCLWRENFVEGKKNQFCY